MDSILDSIAQADDKQIEILLQAVLQRYNALFPEWEILTVSTERCNDKNEQLCNMIRVIESLKTLS